jgi:hypothetical protein
LGRTLAVSVVVAAVVPALALVSVALESPKTPPAAPTAPTATAPVVDVTPIERDVALLQEAWRRERLRALHAERGDRLRVLGRLIAKARDVRRAAGQAGPDLRGPFPLAELGDVEALGLGPDRWLIGRDGVVFAPVGVAVPAVLATTGRDEEPLEVAAQMGGDVTLVRRCVPNEGYCLVDVDRGPPAAPAVDLSLLRTAAAPAAAVVPATLVTSSSPAPSTPSRWPLMLAAVIAVAISAFVASRLIGLSAQLRQLAFRLRHRQRRRSDHDLSAQELNDLDQAIDEALAGLDDELAAVQLQERRRERLQAFAATLDDAANRGGVPRLVALDDDDAALAGLAFSVNALLDALDARALRFKIALADLDDTTQVLPAMAQRLLRLARHPQLPAAAIEELTNLGNAVGQRVRKLNTLPVLVDEVARLTPASSDVITRAAAVAPFAPDDALRLAVADQAPNNASDDDTDDAASTGTNDP